MNILLVPLFIFVYGAKCEYQYVGKEIQSEYKYLLHSNKQATGCSYFYEMPFKEFIKECIITCDYHASQCVAINVDKVHKKCYFSSTITGLQDGNYGWACVTKREVCSNKKS